ncbi:MULTISPECIES: GNAT family N-acetyltransferase [Bacillus]|uniref:GNAT family N-acetyltransferase n=1 Tax=Bacillus TaxID=1386 RepID=UPI0003F73097|nr:MULTISPECIES: GNAT family N-acetyltransferase [Bacillus]QHZ47529.1 GNAT family N-acetyltransferase [Bacillus sp. NSP9.1]
MLIRHAEAADYEKVAPVINDWWGGRNMQDKLPRLFFDHFQHTSFIAEKGGDLIGFLIGFLSQTNPEESYIHFVGVHPDYRKIQVGKKLYEAFYRKAKEAECKTVRCITSPVNKVSIAYHRKMGFSIEKGDKISDGIHVFSNYDGPNQDRVLFVKEL